MVIRSFLAVGPIYSQCLRNSNSGDIFSISHYTILGGDCKSKKKSQNSGYFNACYFFCQNLPLFWRQKWNFVKTTVFNRKKTNDTFDGVKLDQRGKSWFFLETNDTFDGVKFFKVGKFIILKKTNDTFDRVKLIILWNLPVFRNKRHI